MYLCMVATQTFLFSSMESLQAYSARYQVGSSSISEASRTRSFGVSVHSLRDFRPATHAEARQFRSRWLIIDAWRTVAVDGTTLTEALAYPVHGTLRELQRTHDVRHAHPSIHVRNHQPADSIRRGGPVLSSLDQAERTQQADGDEHRCETCSPQPSKPPKSPYLKREEKVGNCLFLRYLVIHLSRSLLCKNHLAAARDMLRRIPGRGPLDMGLI